VFVAPALGHLIKGRVRPPISLAYPAPNQVPRLVRAAPPGLVPAIWVLSSSRTQQLPFVEAQPGRHADQRQQKSATDLTGYHPEHPTRGSTSTPQLLLNWSSPLRAFGTKRSWMTKTVTLRHTSITHPLPIVVCRIRLYGICETPSVNLRVLLGVDQAWGRWSLNGPAARQGVARPAGRG
jgi:hypothetical protein